MESQHEVKLFVLIGTLIIVLMIILIILFVVIQSNRIVVREQEHRNEILMKDTDALRNLIESIENEKNRISKDLHDDVGPILSILKLRIDDPSSIDSQKELIDKLINNIRNACQELTPNFILKFGLTNSLEQFNNSLPEKYKIEFLGLNSIDFSSENSNWQISLYRILTELVNNSIKHSNCQCLKMTFVFKNNGYSISFEYKGHGLSNEQYLQLIQNNRSLGLKSVSDRLILIKGVIDFKTNSEFSLTNINIPKHEIEY